MLNIRLQCLYLYAFLLHRVAVAHSYASIFKGIEVVRDAKRRTDLILPTVALANRPGFVKIDHKVF